MKITSLTAKLSSLFFSLLILSSTAIADERFQIQDNGTVKDTFENLVWLQNPTLIPQLSQKLTWTEGRDACKNLVFGDIGPDAWRLPHINELKSIADTNFKNPTINTAYFSSFSDRYWSQTPHSPGSQAWTLNFKSTALGTYDMDNSAKPYRAYVRCVTSAQ